MSVSLNEGVERRALGKHMSVSLDEGVERSALGKHMSVSPVPPSVPAVARGARCEGSADVVTEGSATPVGVDARPPVSFL
jgi:hypothetical protein